MAVTCFFSIPLGFHSLYLCNNRFLYPLQFSVLRPVYSILFYSVLFYSILFSSLLFYSILFYSILISSVLFSSLLFSSLLFSSLLFYSILFWIWIWIYTSQKPINGYKREGTGRAQQLFLNRSPLLLKSSMFIKIVLGGHYNHV